MFKRTILGGVLSIGIGAQVCAQQAADSDQGAVGPRLEEIIVTAQRREERLIDVPISISAIDQERFDQINATSFTDIAAIIPNLQVVESASGTTARVITIRGIGVFPRNLGIDQGIGFYLDGVSLGRNAAYNLDLEDIERVEVLRGPQGTLYGRNAIGGAINYITQRPDATFHGDINLRYVDFDDSKRLGGSVNVPLSESTYMRASGAAWDSSGYVRNAVTGHLINGNDGGSGRIRLRTLPTDGLTVDLSLDALHEHSGLQGLQPLDGRFFVGPYIANVDYESHERRELYGASASVNYQMPNGFSVDSISAWRRQQLFEAEDGDSTPIPIIITPEYRVNEDEYSQELRLSSPVGEMLDFVSGLYYLHTQANSVNTFVYPGNFPLPSSNPGPDYTLAAIRSQAYAAFGQVNWHLTSRLTLTGGARYNIEEKNLNYRETGTSDYCCLFPSSYYPLLKHRSDHVLTWTGSVKYKVADETNVYMTASRGFKAGGFNADINVDPTLPIEFKPEFVNSYEVGLKTALVGGRIQVNFDVYTLRYKDLQTAVLVPPEFEAVAINAGRVTSSGAELDFGIQPFDHLRLTGGVGYADGYYAQFDAGPFLGGDVSGNRLPSSPRWSGNATGEYTVPLAKGHLSFIANLNSRASDFTTYVNDVRLPSRTLIGARIGYSAPNDRWSLYVFSDNLADKRYLTSQLALFRSTFGTYGAPRSVGVEARASF